MGTLDLSTLNPQQRRAVETVEGRVLILAGAGSGKTRVLTMRMAYLMENLGVRPENILGLTFTNKAAQEMRHRIATLVEPKKAKQVVLGTFHFFCLSVLKKHIHLLGFSPSFTIYDEADLLRLAKLIARDILSHDSELPSLASSLATISFARNRALTPDELPSTGQEWFDNFNRELYRRLEEGLRAYNALDFDSMQTLTLRLFREHPQVLEEYQQRFRYLMIDEYQDTNPVQYRLAECLSASHDNLCVVGDDDQSIYGWRGADVRNILEFSQATVIKLEQNYRSTNTILQAANAVIGCNAQRHDKKLWSDRGGGQGIEVFHAPTEVEEAGAVAHRMNQWRLSRGLRWRDMAVLYRSNALSRQLELALMKYTWQDGSRWVKGIPYQVFGGTEFYERKEVKDMLAYLRVVANPSDQEALLRVINQPRRGIGEGTLNELVARSRERRVPLWTVLEEAASPEKGGSFSLQGKPLHGLQRFVALVGGAKERFRKGNLGEACQWLTQEAEMRRAIAEEVKSDKMRTFKWENVQELAAALGEYDSDAADPSLADFLSSTSLMREGRDRDRKVLGADCVSLMTIHSAKGLEFPAVFLVGMEDDIIPHARSMQETGLEEERRLMYVAITRAMRYLCCSMARERNRMGKVRKSVPSRFMMEMPKELLECTKWDG